MRTHLEQQKPSNPTLPQKIYMGPVGACYPIDLKNVQRNNKKKEKEEFTGCQVSSK
jgi:hypothetical protein